MRILFATVALLSISSARVGFADIVASWTFESSIPIASGPHAAEAGLFAATSFASSNSDGTFSNPAGNGSAESFSSNGWADGEFYLFTTSTAGFQGVSISYAQAASNTGPRDFQFQYSTDGTTFTNFGSVFAGPTPDFNGGTFNALNVLNFDLSSISALNNQVAVAFRVAVSGTASENGGTIAAGGTFRIDDFVVNATAVPEPSIFGMLGFFGLVLVGRRSRA